MSIVSSKAVERVASLFLGVWLWFCLIIATSRLVASFPFGLEGSDEGSYLLFITNPWGSPGLGLFYGFLLHPLWDISGGCVANFRQAGTLVLGLMVLGLAFSLWGFLRGHHNRGWLWAIIPSLLLAGFTHYTRGIRTPGYDWTTLVGALIFASGWICLETERGRWRNLGELIVAGGLLVLAAGKWLVLPGYAVLTGIILTRKFPPVERWWFILRVSSWLAFFFLIFLCYAGIDGICSTWKAGMVYNQSGDRVELVGMYVGWLLGYAWVIVRALLWVVGLYGMVWAAAKFILQKKPRGDLVAATVFILGLGLALVRGHFQGGINSWGKGSMLVGTWVTGVLMTTIPYAGFRRNISEALRSPAIRIVLLLVSIPILNAAGTITGLTNYISHGSVFLVAAGWVVLVRSLARGISPICLTAAFVCIGTLQATRIYTTPEDIMRVGKAWDANSLVRSGPEAGKLFLHESTVHSLMQIDKTLKQHGFSQGDPLIGWVDLCGLVYLLGGTSPGSSWYLGGIQGHLKNTAASLLERTWVLLREGMPEPSNFWPKSVGVALPIGVAEHLYWPEGDAEGVLRSVYLYRPVQCPNQKD